MIDIIQAAEKHDIKLQVIPVECLGDIKKDIEQFKQSENLNGFQRWITDERYVLDIPALDFAAQSIIVAVAPVSLVKATFTNGGKTAHDMLEYMAIDINAILGGILSENGCRCEYVHWLPQKRLAVRCGLAEYGRNNITYSGNYGSFIKIATFISNIPAGSYTWRAVKQMTICDSCGTCIKKCPTGAILPNRFLIDNEKCLSRLNEWGTDDFPEWIPSWAHNHVNGCYLCQNTCPMNKARLQNITESETFTEQETAFLLDPDKKADPSKELLGKLKKYDMYRSYESLPRNLKAIFANINNA